MIKKQFEEERRVSVTSSSMLDKTATPAVAIPNNSSAESSPSRLNLSAEGLETESLSPIREGSFGEERNRPWPAAEDRTEYAAKDDSLVACEQEIENMKVESEKLREQLGKTAQEKDQEKAKGEELVAEIAKLKEENSLQASLIGEREKLLNEMGRTVEQQQQEIETLKSTPQQEDEHEHAVKDDSLAAREQETEKMKVELDKAAQEKAKGEELAAEIAKLKEENSLQASLVGEREKLLNEMERTMKQQQQEIEMLKSTPQQEDERESNMEIIKKEVFFALAVAIKLNLSLKGQKCNQSIMSVYQTMQENNVNYSEWSDWIPKQFVGEEAEMQDVQEAPSPPPSEKSTTRKHKQKEKKTVMC